MHNEFDKRSFRNIINNPAKPAIVRTPVQEKIEAIDRNIEAMLTIPEKEKELNDKLIAGEISAKEYLTALKLL